MKNFILIIFVMCVCLLTASSQSRHHEGNTISTQEQIDSRHINFPLCTDIKGDVTFGYDVDTKSRERLNHRVPKQKSLIQIMDSTYFWKWDTVSGWKNNYKEIEIVYDNNYNLISNIRQKWNVNYWENYTQYTYTYDANNNMTNKIIQDWNGIFWENSYHLSNTYDANNNSTNTLIQTWNGNYWVNQTQYTYTYDASNNMINYIYQIWNDIDWVNFRQSTYTYDANNNMINDLYQIWNDGDWENYLLLTYAYDANNIIINRLGQVWYGTDWENSMQVTYTHDANNNMVDELYKLWNGISWENSYHTTYTYDANNNMVSYLRLVWNYNQWVIYLQVFETYDDKNFILSSSLKRWDATGNSIISGDSTFYYFHTSDLGTDDFVLPKHNILVYPNPAISTFTIQTDNQIIDEIKIYTLTGQQVLKARTVNGKVDISHFQSGMYIVEVMVEGRKFRQKLLVQ